MTMQSLLERFTSPRSNIEIWRLSADDLKLIVEALSAATALSQAEGAPDRDAVLAAVLHEFGPSGCAKVLARLPEARDYVNALRKPTRPREQEGADIMSEIDELERLAREALPRPDESAAKMRADGAWRTDFQEAENDWDSEWMVRKRAFKAATTPDVVLALIAASRLAAPRATTKPLPTRPREQDGAEPVAYPTGIITGPCICGSWPGGPCLRCPIAHPLPAASFQAGAEAMREAAEKVCQQWLDGHAGVEIQYTSASEYATGAVLDLKEVIEALPIPASSEGR